MNPANSSPTSAKHNWLDLGELDGPVLVFGGPYSNLAATRALQLEAERLGLPARRVLCTGDLVAYCAEPNQTVQLIRDWGIPVLLGNCEESLAADAADCGCGFDADSQCSLLSVQWYRYAQHILEPGFRHWMGRLPHALRFTLNGLQFHLVHGSPRQINEFVFASSAVAHKAQMLSEVAADVVLGGHCGLPFGQAIPGGYWLNAGVIGLPANDGTADGWYLLLSPAEVGVEARWQRLHYPAAQAQQAMRQAGLDNGYADALSAGLWPSLDVLPQHERAARGVALAPPRLQLNRQPR